ncbi:MAG: sigma-70 family RNA polymerase sigma factor [Dehalococcoidia bacterium]|nr:MAG: sigma-70 family RNA polymerase sigma factor [Dehalococcoidia bacterium]
MQEYRTTETLSDIEKLVDRAIDGDAEAFGRLYDMHVDRVYRHIYYRVGDVADAEDLTQQVFIKAWQAIGRYKKTASPFLSWLIRISHNLVIDFYRSNKTKTCLDFDIVASEPESGPEHLAEAKFDQQQVRHAILELPGEQQQVVLMRFIEGFSYPEIAASIGKSEGAVRVIQHRALARLRKTLEKVKQ